MCLSLNNLKMVVSWLEFCSGSCCKALSLLRSLDKNPIVWRCLQIAARWLRIAPHTTFFLLDSISSSSQPFLPYYLSNHLPTHPLTSREGDDDDVFTRQSSLPSWLTPTNLDWYPNCEKNSRTVIKMSSQSCRGSDINEKAEIWDYEYCLSFLSH